MPRRAWPRSTSQKMADDRERVLAEWSKRYEVEGGAEELGAAPRLVRRPLASSERCAETAAHGLHPWTKSSTAAAPGSIGGGARRRPPSLTCGSRASPSASAPSRALDDVSLEVESGKLVCFLGPSGCGKTTLLRVIAGLEVQDAGSIEIGGRDVTRLPPAQRDFGIVFQSYALFPNLTVAQNVGYGLVNRRKARARDRGARGRAADSWSACPSRAPSIPRSCRAASSSAWRWPARWRPRPRCCCWTSRCRRSMRGCACACATRSRRCSAGSASPPSWSRTTRRRRWPWPTASW